MSEASGSPAHKVYNIRHWSDGYIDVNPQGEVVIRPDRGHSAASINLPELTRRLEQAGVPLPVLIRFTDILHDRVNRLCRAFNTVAEAEGYRGRYTAVYPIKVNQQRRVVEELLTTEPAASAGQVGLEAGSKPELMAVLAMARQPGSVIVCNGYKDREYIRLALIGQKLGHRVFIVVEKQSELPIILEQARQLQVKPLIGVRARLATIGKGNTKVLAARFHDAKFFYAEDRKQSLAEHGTSLTGMQWIRKAGTMSEKAARVSTVARALSGLTGADAEVAARLAGASDPVRVPRAAAHRPGGSGEERDIRPGDVLRACSTISSTIVYGNAMFPLDGANTKWRRTLAPCDMQPFETVMEQVTSNEGTILLVIEREIK